MRPQPMTIALWAAACAAVACVALLASPALGARPPATCPPLGVEVFKRFEDVVVYRRPPRERNRASSVNVCIRATRRATRVSYEGYYEGFAGRRALAARGTTVAWARVTNDDGADGDIAIMDVIAADFGSVPPAAVVSARTSVGLNLDCSLCTASAVSQIVIAADRSVVWISCNLEADIPGDRTRELHDRCHADADREVWAARAGDGFLQPSAKAGALRRLGRGATIGQRSLRLSADGRSVSWRQRGARRSATL